MTSMGKTILSTLYFMYIKDDDKYIGLPGF